MADEFAHGNFTVRLYTTDEGAIGSGNVRGHYLAHPSDGEDPALVGATASVYVTWEDAESAAKALAIPEVEKQPGWKQPS